MIDFLITILICTIFVINFVTTIFFSVISVQCFDDEDFENESLFYKIMNPVIVWITLFDEYYLIIRIFLCIILLPAIIFSQILYTLFIIFKTLSTILKKKEYRKK